MSGTNADTNQRTQTRIDELVQFYRNWYHEDIARFHGYPADDVAAYQQWTEAAKEEYESSVDLGDVDLRDELGFHVEYGTTVAARNGATADQLARINCLTNYAVRDSDAAAEELIQTADERYRRLRHLEEAYNLPEQYLTEPVLTAEESENHKRGAPAE